MSDRRFTAESLYRLGSGVAVFWGNSMIGRRGRQTAGSSGLSGSDGQCAADRSRDTLWSRRCLVVSGVRCTLFLVVIFALVLSSYKLNMAAWWGMLLYVCARALSESSDAYIGMIGSEANLDPLGPRVLSTCRGFLGRDELDWARNLVQLGAFLILILWNRRYFRDEPLYGVDRFASNA